MEPRDKSLPTGKNKTPEWEEEIVAENKDTARGDTDSRGGKEKDTGKKKKEEKERRELATAAAAAKMKAKNPKAVATKAQAGGGAPGGNEYILEGFDFSTGTVIF
jgi:hypothetical protein